MNLKRIAKNRGCVVLVMDRDAASFYIDLLEVYNLKRQQAGKTLDLGVLDDMKELRRQYLALWGEADPDDLHEHSVNEAINQATKDTND